MDLRFPGFIARFTNKAPAQRGFIGDGIVPSGDLAGTEGSIRIPYTEVIIVPFGDLTGTEDSRQTVNYNLTIVSSGKNNNTKTHG